MATIITGAMALALGSVEEAFKDKELAPILKERLRALFGTELRKILKEEGQSEEEIAQYIDTHLEQMAKEGFFRVPPISEAFNDTMRQVMIQQIYVETAA